MKFEVYIISVISIIYICMKNINSELQNYLVQLNLGLSLTIFVEYLQSTENAITFKTKTPINS